MFFPFYVIAIGLFDEERVSKVVDVGFDGSSSNGDAFHRLEGILQLLWIRQPPDARSQNGEKLFQFGTILDLVSLLNINQIGFL